MRELILRRLNETGSKRYESSRFPYVEVVPNKEGLPYGCIHVRMYSIRLDAECSKTFDGKDLKKTKHIKEMTCSEKVQKFLFQF